MFVKYQKCLKCSKEAKITKHHKIPKSKGGSDRPENIEFLCRKCHDKVHGIVTAKSIEASFKKFIPRKRIKKHKKPHKRVCIICHYPVKGIDKYCPFCSQKMNRKIMILSKNNTC